MIATFDFSNGWIEHHPKLQRTPQAQESWYLGFCEDEHELAVIYDGETPFSVITWELGMKVASRDAKAIEEAIEQCNQWFEEC